MTTPTTTTAGKTGIFGGSFDPVHLGHLIHAVDLLDAGLVDEVIFVPAAQSPFKCDRTITAGSHRVNMLKLALEHVNASRVWEGELARPGPSYSVITARELSDMLPDNALFWILGGDQLASLPRWHRAHELVAQVRFIAMARPGYDLTPPDEFPAERFTLHRVRHLDISSSEIRERLQKGKNADFFLPSAVNRYIHSHHLYGT